VAYAEKRGKSTKAWRVKYKLASGKEGSESGFATRAAALAWGRDQEAIIRQDRRGHAAREGSQLASGSTGGSPCRMSASAQWRPAHT
jgi:hypothetical protein